MIKLSEIYFLILKIHIIWSRFVEFYIALLKLGEIYFLIFNILIIWSKFVEFDIVFLKLSEIYFLIETYILMTATISRIFPNNTKNFAQEFGWIKTCSR